MCGQKSDHVWRKRREDETWEEKHERAAERRIELLPEQRNVGIRRMARYEGINQARREVGNREREKPGRHEQPREETRALETIRPAAAEPVAEREGHEHHADLARPDVECAAEIFDQKTRADDFQHHHGEAAEEDEQDGRGRLHEIKLGETVPQTQEI
ncbi:MAG: hypothetical protein EXS29_04380 [Pedosphaera sp.]|nr:hypothetical protein [Pedosphaera sp.]MST00534.1 hypothetical protein [Pedosphaera sp.]